jgi:hypothetical protein
MDACLNRRKRLRLSPAGADTRPEGEWARQRADIQRQHCMRPWSTWRRTTSSGAAGMSEMFPSGGVLTHQCPRCETFVPELLLILTKLGIRRREVTDFVKITRVGAPDILLIEESFLLAWWASCRLDWFVARSMLTIAPRSAPTLVVPALPTGSANHNWYFTASRDRCARSAAPVTLPDSVAAWRRIRTTLRMLGMFPGRRVKIDGPVPGQPRPTLARDPPRRPRPKAMLAHRLPGAGQVCYGVARYAAWSSERSASACATG